MQPSRGPPVRGSTHLLAGRRVDMKSLFFPFSRATFDADPGRMSTFVNDSVPSHTSTFGWALRWLSWHYKGHINANGAGFILSVLAAPQAHEWQFLLDVRGDRYWAQATPAKTAGQSRKVANLCVFYRAQFCGSLMSHNLDLWVRKQKKWVQTRSQARMWTHFSWPCWTDLVWIRGDGSYLQCRCYL